MPRLKPKRRSAPQRQPAGIDWAGEHAAVDRMRAEQARVEQQARASATQASLAADPLNQLVERMHRHEQETARRFARLEDLIIEHTGAIPQ